MRLRQVVLVAADLETVVGQIRDVFEIEPGYPDPGVELFGLQNMVMAFGDTFLEVVSPIQDNTAAGRYRDRRGGDCGYMVMVQSDDYRRDRERIEGLGVRIVWSAELDDISGMHLHPRDTGGPLLSLDEPKPPASWRWAGPSWVDRSSTDNVQGIVAAEITDPDPTERARRWGEILDRPARLKGKTKSIELDRGTLRFVATDDPANAGLAQIDVQVRNRETTILRAERRNALVGKDTVRLGGALFNLV